MSAPPAPLQSSRPASFLSAPPHDTEAQHHGPPPTVEQRPFGRTPDGPPVRLFTLSNEEGTTVEVTNYGGTIVSICTPDRTGTVEDVALGFDALSAYTSAAYRSANPYVGALIGRYANRIEDGQFAIGDTTYQLDTNHGRHHLHGGADGFDQAVWSAAPVRRSDSAGIVLRHSSPDGHCGYPGRLDVEVTYTLTRTSALVIDYRATTTHATPVNLTQHTYFHLGGDGHGSVLDHELVLNAERFTPVDSSLIPTGALRPVAGTPFDFRTPRRIGDRIDDSHPQLRHAGGYDHNFVLGADEQAPTALPQPAAQVYDSASGRVLTVYTTEPGLQLYTGALPDAALENAGERYGRRRGLALETQHFPDAPNHSHFPPTILEPGTVYRSRTLYQFSTRPAR